jgi:hypothetical protein
MGYDLLLRAGLIFVIPNGREESLGNDTTDQASRGAIGKKSVGIPFFSRQSLSRQSLPSR